MNFTKLEIEFSGNPTINLKPTFKTATHSPQTGTRVIVVTKSSSQKSVTSQNFLCPRNILCRRIVHFYDRGPREPGGISDPTRWLQTWIWGLSMPAGPFILAGVATRRRPAPCCFLVMGKLNVSISIKIFYNWQHISFFLISTQIWFYSVTFGDT